MQNLIGGVWTGAKSGGVIPVTDPATDEVIAEVPRGGQEEAESAIAAAFEGMKQSGFGREGGKYVMNEYVEIEYVSWGGV